MPEPTHLSSIPSTEPATIPTLDGWIETLMTCKQLAESDVQRLCEKVCEKRYLRMATGGRTSANSCVRIGSRGSSRGIQRTASGKRSTSCFVDMSTHNDAEMSRHCVW
jgi:hypothetical protein